MFYMSLNEIQWQCVDLKVGSQKNYDINHMNLWCWHRFLGISLELTNPAMLTDHRMTQRFSLYAVCAIDSIIYIP